MAVSKLQRTFSRGGLGGLENGATVVLTRARGA
jgi:hypothetical protein